MTKQGATPRDRLVSLRPALLAALGVDGKALPGFPSDVAVLGDTATWSAPVEVAGALEQHIYVANLAAGTVKRLEPVARWPFPDSPDTLVAAVATGTTSDHKVLAEPAKVAIADGVVTSLGIIKPARLLAQAASQSGSVTLRYLSESAAGQTVADAVTNLGGVVRVFPLPVDWGGVGAGNGSLTWTDQLHLWVLPGAGAQPVQLAGVADMMGNLRPPRFVPSFCTVARLWRQ